MTSETFASTTTAVTEQREPTGDRETRIAVIGSTGRTGKLVLAEGLRRGYALTAFTRRPAELAGIDGLSAIVEGDGRRADDVRRAVQGQDAVISIVAPAGRGPTTVVSDAMGALLEGCGRLASDVWWQSASPRSKVAVLGSRSIWSAGSSGSLTRTLHGWKSCFFPASSIGRLFDLLSSRMGPRPDASEVRPGGRISLMDPITSHAPTWRRPSSISRRIRSTFGTYCW